MSDLHTTKISTSYPYLSIAKKFGVDYGGVLILGEIGQRNDIAMEGLFSNKSREELLQIAGADLTPRELGPVCDLIEDLYRLDDDWDENDIPAFGTHMDAAADLAGFIDNYAADFGLQIKDAWRPKCDWQTVVRQFLDINNGEIPF